MKKWPNYSSEPCTQSYKTSFKLRFQCSLKLGKRKNSFLLDVEFEKSSSFFKSASADEKSLNHFQSAQNDTAFYVKSG